MVPPLPASNPVEQAISWIGFGTESNRNRIRFEGGLEVFNGFVGLTESDIRDTASGFSKKITAQG